MTCVTLGKASGFSIDFKTDVFFLRFGLMTLYNKILLFLCVVETISVCAGNTFSQNLFVCLCCFVAPFIGSV